MKMYNIKNCVLLAMTLSIFMSCYAQKQETYTFTYANFEKEILNYIPQKRTKVSDASYQRAVSILENTKESIENDSNNFVVTDYWNLTLALAMLDESKENIKLPFKKGIDKNKPSMCEYIDKVTEVSPKTNSILANAIPELYTNFTKSCTTVITHEKATTQEDPMMDNMDKELVRLMKKIQADDTKYRQNNAKYRANLEKQTRLDLKNQKAIDSIYQIHNTYIGKSMVGEKLSITMWLVIQHSNIEMMKRYVPIVYQAAKNKEIKETPFKMLIDRVYAVEKGYQIFGSQGGVKKANDSIRNAIKEKYKLN